MISNYFVLYMCLDEKVSKAKVTLPNVRVSKVGLAKLLGKGTINSISSQDHYGAVHKSIVSLRWHKRETNVSKSIIKKTIKVCCHITLTN